MLTLIIGICGTLIVSFVILSTIKHKVDVEVVGVSILFTCIAAVIFTAVWAILSTFLVNSVQCESVGYTLVESIFDNDSYYVSSDVKDGKVEYSVTCVDSKGSTQNITIGGEYAKFEFTHSEPYVIRKTMTIPDSWKLWAYWRDSYIYEIHLSSLDDIK